MKTIIGYTDSITECECCGKVDLKGTYCIELDGVELYYGSTCAFKVHGITDEEQKEVKKVFNKEAQVKKALLKKEAQLDEMLTSSKGTQYEKNQIVAWIQKKGLDLKAFMAKHGNIIEDAKYYKAYEYGSRIVLIEK